MRRLRGDDVKPWLALAVLVALVFALSNGLFGFDGDLAEPGCDWGNPNCEPSDYRAMCKDYSGSVFDARWQEFCKGRAW